MYLPSPDLIGLAVESIEKAKNHLNNQEYPDFVKEVARAKARLLDGENSLTGRKGRSIVRKCGLSEDNFNKFESYLPDTALLGDGEVLMVQNP